MKKVFRNISPLYFIVDLIVISASFFAPYFWKFNRDLLGTGQWTFPFAQEHFFIFCLWTLLIMTGFRRYGLYQTDRTLSLFHEMFRAILRVIYASVIISAIIFYSKYKFFSREVFVESLVLLCVTLSGWRFLKRLLIRRIVKKGFHNINVLIIGSGKPAHLVIEEIQTNPYWGFRIVGCLDDQKEGEVGGVPILGKTSDCLKVLRRFFVDEIIITDTQDHQRIKRIIHLAQELRVGVRVVPEDFSQSLTLLSITHLGIISLLTYKERIHHPSEFVLKRFLDICLSSLALFVLSPVFCIIAILIKLSSPGPVFYVQRRVGHKGAEFNLYKFRSMVQDADHMKKNLLDRNEVRDGVIFKMKEDPRVTTIGRFLRKYSLDEFPQFWNVLKGDMSLVGPRPPTPEEVREYHSAQMVRLSIRPGLTCLSQVKGRSQLTFKEWVKWDLWYIRNWSFRLDFQILMWTISVVLKGKGAY